MQAIVEKEEAIRQRDSQILALIDEELDAGCSDNQPLAPAYPTLFALQRLGRLDAAVYDREYEEKMHRIRMYRRGTLSPSQAGFTITPGPSLEIKLLRTRIDSDVPKPGFYTLILPTHISEYGTMNTLQYLGTSSTLPLLKQGDIVFGEAGFHKGRSIVLVEGLDRCTTNAHGLYARRTDGDLIETIFFRCIFNWYRHMRLIDMAAVGGSGGHFSPSYFDKYILIPKFSDEKKGQIARLYHNPSTPPSDEPSLETLLDWHREWNASLGIWELDRQLKELRKTLIGVQDRVIAGQAVEIPPSFARR